MTRPALRVYVGFGSTWQTEPASIVWTDITSEVMDRRQAVGIRRGASAAYGLPDTGQLDLTLRNHDRRFDPLNTAGIYYGSLKPGVPIKVECEIDTGGAGALLWDVDALLWDIDPLLWNAGSLPLWWGSVRSWPQRYDRGNRTATVPVVAFDGFDKLARA